MSFTVKALTPKGEFFTKVVSEAYFPSVNGPIGIFTDYAPGFIVLQDAGVIRIRENNEDIYYAVFGGVVKTDNNVVTILTDDIEDGYSIDMARAIAARDRANDRIASVDPNIDYARAKRALKRSMTRISVKTLTHGAK